ncbi:MAG: alcohol dehydrogenase catalytic domain-containing protein [Candidatus Thermoplasmatota archaeon]|nr:alcohol dehydrogenase catalytic domain-containing protein [Candidatus Thermoplasmatota archaeon]MCL5731685.1 alcohol dehydrogenase catalytic domain-containing protein [Candidatus Thermoplasmatota archaeon]
MKAAVIKDFNGFEGLSVSDVDPAKKAPDEISVRVSLAGLNPVDINLMAGKILYSIDPIPHIPGVELFGEAEEDGRFIRKGDRVIVFPRMYDGTCHYCVNGMEEICVNGKLFGVGTNGAYAENANISEKYLIRVPDEIDDETAVGLPVGGLTAMHAISAGRFFPGKNVLVYGASGNTGIFSLILLKALGMHADAVSRKEWVTRFGAENVFTADRVPDNKSYDMVINPLGSFEFSNALSKLRRGGEYVTYGIMGGSSAYIDLGRLYTNEIRIIGSTGGNRRDMENLIRIMSESGIKVPVQKKFSLDEIVEACRTYSGRETGRYLIKI